MRGHRDKLQVRPEAHQGADIGPERLRPLQRRPRRHRPGPQLVQVRAHQEGHRCPDGPRGRSGREDPRHIRPGQEHRVPEHRRRPLRIRGRGQDIHRRQLRGLLRIPRLHACLLRGVPGHARSGDQGRGGGAPDPDRHAHPPRLQGRHRQTRKEARRPAASHMVLLQRWREGLRALRLLPSEATGLQGGRVQGRDRVRARREPL